MLYVKNLIETVDVSNLFLLKSFQYTLEFGIKI
jgi:hypothetical protein